MHSNTIYSFFRRAGTTKTLAAVLMLGAAACASPEQKVERYTDSGVEFLEADEIGKANIQFRNALKINEEHVPALEGLVKISEKRSDFRSMFGLLQRIVRVDPTNVKARIDLSKFYLLSGDEAEALANIDKALEIDARSADAIAVKAAIMFRLDNRDEAIELAQEALAIDPSAQEAVTVIATDLVRQDKPDDAMRVIEDALKADPKAAVLHLLRVQILTQQGRTGDTEEAFRTLISEFPEEAGYRRLFASRLIREGKVDAAREQLVSVVDLLPRDIDAYVDIVRLDYRTGEKAKALDTFNGFIQKQPDFDELKFALAAFHQQEDNRDAALEIYQALSGYKGDDKQSTVLRAQNQIAAIYLANRNREGAEKLIASILKKDERNSDALIKQASLKLADGLPNEAISDLRLVLADEPESTPAKLLMAAAYESTGEMDAAERSLAEAFEANKSNASVATVFARFLLRQDDVDRAERVLTDAVAANSSNETNLRLLAALKLRRQDWRGAEEVATLLDAANDQDDVVNRILGAAYAGLQDYAGAIEVLSAENEERPLASRPLATLINAYVQAGRTGEAEDVLRDAIARDSGNYDARLLLAQVLDSESRSDEARKVLEEAIAASSDRPEAYEGLYRFFRRQQNLDAAGAILDQGMISSPQSDGMKVLKADYFIAIGELEQAIGLYSDILTRRPNDQIVANNYAAILVDLREDQASFDRALAVAQILEGSENASFIDTYGWTLVRAGRVEDGIAQLRRALQLNPDLIDAQFHLGSALVKSGNVDAARNYLQSVIANGAASDAYKQQARELLGQ